MSEEKILNALGLEPIDSYEELDNELMSDEELEETISNSLIESSNQTENQKEVVSDIEFAKENIRKAMTKADEAYAELIAVAKNSEEARHFEVAATMLKSIVDANKEFVNMSEKKKYAKEELPPSQANDANNVTNVTNNNLILSTNDMLKLFKGKEI
jgi:Xaa-Pro aminopeptidase